MIVRALGLSVCHPSQSAYRAQILRSRRSARDRFFQPPALEALQQVRPHATSIAHVLKDVDEFGLAGFIPPLI